MLASEIKKKMTYDKPYFATDKTIDTITTEIDTFPYTGFFRGEWNNHAPVIFKRQGGYRPLNKCHDPIYFINNNVAGNNDNKMNTFFQAASNTIYPVFPEFLDKYNDKQKIEIGMNKKCLNKQL
jgi:hypothetical protein